MAESHASRWLLGDDLIQLFVAQRCAQAAAHGFVGQPFGDQRQRMQVSFTLIGRYQQGEQQNRPVDYQWHQRR